ncbi:DNase I-like protein [Macrolepiota fuliginosa MF-IS2]|uniref:DNase I-like protein n=1 Tax=Macrolepiota fuliginosa MF-IS2 TaxID=1400762 RepID=A0A9P5XRV1_9AGAR|nr:DNase I-like protein [Macrolepiota fuliginosa MF-IS2]
MSVDQNTIERLLSSNAQWAEDVKLAEPDFFIESAKGQSPHTLWIGCSDSRVPDSSVTGTRPGEIFVHRNIANQLHSTDVNFLAVLDECGGAAACLDAVQREDFTPDEPIATIPNLPIDAPLNRWLEPLTRHVSTLGVSTTPRGEALPLVVEENIKNQVKSLCKTQTIVDAWTKGTLKGQDVWVHGWIALPYTRCPLFSPPSTTSPSELQVMASEPERLQVQIASYNTNLQGVLGLPQDLVDWLAPTLQVSHFLTPDRRAPDVVAVGFQELLPLHLGLCGFSRSVIENRNALILSQIEACAPNKQRYSLIAQVVNVGVALLVYGRDDGIARKVLDVQTQWTGFGPLFMGNKGAVGVRFRVCETDEDAGETYTFVNAHLTPHDHNVARRNADYEHIVRTLLFPPVDSGSKTPSTLYETSHLFFLGDLNYRLEIPRTHPVYAIRKLPEFSEALGSEKLREEIKEYDQLTVEKRKGTVFVGLREGEFWKFKCSYKYHLGDVDKYRWVPVYAHLDIKTKVYPISPKRTPSWTDRVLYTTFTDPPEDISRSNITNMLYTSIPSYTTSDHKPIVSLLLMPPRSTTRHPSIPRIQLPASYQPTPDPRAMFKRYFGRCIDRAIGFIWWLLTLLGAGSGLVGIFNFVVGLGAWTWFKGKPPSANSSV